MNRQHVKCWTTFCAVSAPPRLRPEFWPQRWVICSRSLVFKSIIFFHTFACFISFAGIGAGAEWRRPQRRGGTWPTDGGGLHRCRAAVRIPVASPGPAETAVVRKCPGHDVHGSAAGQKSGRDGQKLKGGLHFLMPCLITISSYRLFTWKQIPRWSVPTSSTCPSMHRWKSRPLIMTWPW